MAINKNENKEKFKEIELIAYGCNRRVFYALSEFLNRHGIQSFTFYEFFCTAPISKEKFKDEKQPLPKLLCPFVKRYAIGLPLLPMKAVLKGNSKIELDRKIRDGNTLKKFYKPIEIPLKKKSDTWNVIEKWTKVEKWHQQGTFLSKEKSINDFKKYLKTGNKMQQREFAIVNMSWWEYLQENNSKKVTFIYMPIASEAFFYGELLLIIAGNEIDVGVATKKTTDDKRIEDTKKEIVERKEKIVRKLKSIANKDYLPLLILFENYWHEKELKHKIRKINDNDNPFPSSKAELEKTFSKIWGWRKAFSKKLLDDSLIMAKYIVASPGMIETLRGAVTLDPKDSSKPIPCILVVGGPGTGKEKMAKLIARYSRDFRKASVCTINMASLQPRQIAGPIISGFTSSSMKLKGLLQQIIKDTRNNPVVIIFDELNSLDIDSQGTLLRLIENRELTSIGSIKNELEKNKNKKILIIGLMNEDPEMLTKLSRIHNIARDKELFGGLVGDIVYEYVRNLRRLRDDLYYRMKRNGIIRIPELRKRVEDLPFLFYIFLLEELKNELGEEKLKKKDVIVEYECFEILMDTSIEWPGNIRQLQAVAKAVLQLLKTKKKLENGTIIIDRFMLKPTLINNGLLPRIREEDSPV